MYISYVILLAILIHTRTHYKDLDHPADIQIHSWGNSLSEAFEDAAMAMTRFMCGDGLLYGEDMLTWEEVSITACDMEALVHHFLDEILFLFSQGKVVVGFDRTIIDSQSRECTLTTVALMVDYNPTIHNNGSEVKAVTFSNLQVNVVNVPHDIYVVLDI